MASILGSLYDYLVNRKIFNIFANVQYYLINKKIFLKGFLYIG